MAFKGVIPAGGLKPLPHGLFSAADVKERGSRDDHWGAGFDAMSEACAFDVDLLDVCGGIDPTDVYVQAGDRFKRIRPFGIRAKDACLSVGWKAEDRRARVLRQLGMASQKAVEAELWSGLYRSQWDAELEAAEPGSSETLGYLSHADTEVVEAAAQKPEVALALLEQALADCSPGWQGVIHMSPLVASAVARYLREDDGKLYTRAVGNRVAVGAGYDGRAPGGSAAPGPFVHAMYATGPVRVVLGAEETITVNESVAVDAKTNEMTYVAVRPAAVYTDGCCQFAVQADIRL